jgi:hypothetical protein
MGTLVVALLQLHSPREEGQGLVALDAGALLDAQAVHAPVATTTNRAIFRAKREIVKVGAETAKCG